MLTTAWKYIQPQCKHVILFKFLVSFFFKKEFSLHFYGIHEIGLEIFICFEYMFRCSRRLSAHYS